MTERESMTEVQMFSSRMTGFTQMTICVLFLMLFRALSYNTIQTAVIKTTCVNNTSDDLLALACKGDQSRQ